MITVPWGRTLATAAFLALVGGLLQAPTAVAAEPKVRPLFTNPEKAVHGTRATAAAPAKGGKTSTSAHEAPVELATSTRVLTSGTTSGATVALPGGKKGHLAGSWTALGSSGIRVAPAAAPGAAGTATVSTTLLGAADAARFGVNGVAVLVRKSGAGAADVAVQVPTKVLDGVYGADYADRVHWTQAPADATPATGAGDSVQPATATTASATVVTAQVTSAATVLAATASPVSATGTGDFTATPLKPSSTWDVSAQTGDFSWSYPLRVPPAAAGPAPSLAFAYDSQSVDGETGSTNNQPSSIGEGWSLSGGGFIERSYVACDADDGSGGSVTTSGDLCWKSDNATISFGGHSGELVKDSATGNWVLQSDDGSRIQHLVGAAAGCGAANGTYDDDCWKVTTTDGTQYFFGLSELPGWASGDATTNSAWTVPVYGNDAGEPCHADTFAASACTQAWRWNLDYVVDVNGNAEALYYDAQTNHYSEDGTTAVAYTRGGELDHIDYGITGNSPYASNAASGKVVLAYGADGRCVATSGCTAEGATGQAATPATPADYPDVPFDQNCASGACTGLVSPTFFSTSMLSTVTTEVKSGSSYSKVDVWALTHSFPSPGDGTSAALWLTKIAHTGYSGSTSIAEPATTFSGVTMQNRVWATDGLAPLDKYRISWLTTSTGAKITVNYSAQQCTPDDVATIEADLADNTMRCFPEYWSPGVLPYTAPKLDLFHKYVVTSVISDPVTGGGADLAQETDYAYTGTPAWRYDDSPLIPDDRRTWSQYAGYNTVEVRTGDPSSPSTQQTTAYTFYQGMDGDRAEDGSAKTVYVTGSTTVKDSRWLAGQTREEKTLNGVGGATVADTVHTPWASTVKADDGTDTARFVDAGTDVTTEPLSTGGDRTTTVTRQYDDNYGLVEQQQTATTDAGTTCTLTGYTAPNTDAWIIGTPQRTTDYGQACAAAQTNTDPTQVISDTVDYYDGASVPATPTTGQAAAPSKGQLTATQVVQDYTGSTTDTAEWVTQSQATYDSLGRQVTAVDALGRTTTTAYTPAAAGPLTSQAVTNPAGWKTTTAYNPAWGVETSVTDQNGKLTTAAYDALGRRTGVWNPSASQSGGATASIAYAYTESQTVASTVKTTTQSADLASVEVDLYDGLGRIVQTQHSGGSGTVMSDTQYNAAGQVSLVNNPYVTTQANPTTTLFVPASQQQIPSETDTSYDGAGRTTATTLFGNGVQKNKTSYAYNGADRVDTTPPAGGTPTSSFTNSLGKQTKLVDYLAATPSSTATQEATSYGYDPAGQMTRMTDAAGNVWTWAYDPAGNQVKAVDPDSGTTTSSYDAAGNLLASTDGRGQTLSYTYDSLNRKTAEYAGTTTGSAGVELDSWVYDTLAKGQLTSSTSYVGSKAGTPGLAYTTTIGGYTNLYKPSNETISVPAGAPAFSGTSYTYNYTYYIDGSLDTQREPAVGGLPAETLNYARDSQDQVGSLDGYDLYGVINYSGIGQVIEIERGDGSLQRQWTSMDYDQATGDLLDLGDQRVSGSTSTTVAARQYTRNADGQITSASSQTNSGTDTQCYSYDPLQELTAAWTPTGTDCTAAPSSTSLGGPAPYWDSYTYDPATGNRLEVTAHGIAGAADTTATYTYPAAGAAQPHAVTGIATTNGTTTSTAAYSYDAAGNATTLGALTASYDPQGHTATITASTQSQQDVYDADGNLLVQTDPTGTTLFLPDTQLHLAPGATTASGVRTYSVNGTPIAERTSTVGASTTKLFWLGTDVDGSPDVEVDSATGAITHRYTDPFGNRRGTAAAWSSGNGFLDDPASTLTGLTQIGARLYNPATGSFTTADPLLDTSSMASINAYTYAGNSPIDNTDPTGECLNANGSLDHFTNCAGTGAPGSGTGAAADGSEVHQQKQPGYAQQHEDAIIASDDWVYGAGYYSSPAFGKAVANGVTKAFTFPTAPPGESLEDQAQTMALNTQMQMFQMNSAAAAAPEEAASSALANEVEEGVGISLSYRDAWSPEERTAATNKVGALNDAAESGRLTKTTPVRSVTSASSRYKSAGGSVPDGYDVDHTLDLQLGGADEVANMAPLPASVNRSLGSQVAWALRGVPDGARISSVKIQ